MMQTEESLRQRVVSLIGPRQFARPFKEEVRVAAKLLPKKSGVTEIMRKDILTALGMDHPCEDKVSAEELVQVIHKHGAVWRDLYFRYCVLPENPLFATALVLVAYPKADATNVSKVFTRYYGKDISSTDLRIAAQRAKQEHEQTKGHAADPVSCFRSSAISAFCKDHGVQVTPVLKKVPCVRDSSDDPSTLGIWFDKHPDWMPALSCQANNLVVIDCDHREVERFESLCQSREDVVASSVFQDTPNGRHYFYRDDMSGGSLVRLLRYQTGRAGRILSSEFLANVVVVDPFGETYKMHGNLKDAPKVPTWMKEYGQGEKASFADDAKIKISMKSDPQTVIEKAYPLLQQFGFGIGSCFEYWSSLTPDERQGHDFETFVAGIIWKRRVCGKALKE